MSESKTTVTLPAVPEWAVELTKSVKIGFASVTERLDGLEGTDKTLANEVSRVVIAIEDLRGADRRHEDDIRRLSVRTKDTHATASSATLENEAQLAQERAAREDLAERVKAIDEKQDTQTAALVAIGKDIGNFLATPRVKIAGGILLGLVLKYLADRFGVHL